MLNLITVQGRLTKKPELRYTQNNNAVTSVTLACERDYAANGQQRETDFIDCVAWGKTAEFVDKYFDKGNMMMVTGRLQFRDWEDRDGNRRRNAEILVDHVYFGAGKKESGGETATRASKEIGPAADDAGFFEEADGGDGDLPF